ncbi:MAG: hypothetical protein HFG94_08555 [Dorea sp.]|jgi:hypothetical protein|nr:hypothetical protein [Dorea sp.]MCI9613598.1 hypothetical protein [Dorea sp.]MDE7036865.1 hypothetical protein [Lachnospiraceae bacterium]GFI50856.1 hypothetical protein IMSAGC020_02066 [Lachnospiraceae bacterium]
MFIRKIVTEEDRAKALAKAREKQRKRITKYGQAKPRHAKKGIYSCCYAFVVLLLLYLMVSVSFRGKGEVSILFGFVGLGTIALAAIGIWLGVRGMKEREKNYITCKIGIGVNGIVFLGLAAIFVRGLVR